MVSGTAFASATAGCATVSVIALSLLPFAARQAEIREQRREHQERDHRNRDRRTLAELATGNAALEGQRGQQMRRVAGTATGDGVDQLEISEGEDDREGHD